MPETLLHFITASPLADGDQSGRDNYLLEDFQFMDQDSVNIYLHLRVIRILPMQHHMNLILGNPVHKRAIIIIVQNLFARNIAVKDDLF